MSSRDLHLFDQAIALQGVGENSFAGAPHPAWANMVGPFGGITAASALNGVLQHAGLLGTPISLTVNFASALAPAPYRLQAVPVRTNRSTQHWTMAMTQSAADGTEETVLTATALTGLRRPTWGGDEIAMPQVPPPREGKPMKVKRIEWVDRYDLRFVEGAVPDLWDGSERSSLSRLWVRDEPRRPLDFASLAAMADVFYPRVWLRRATRVPAGTVSMTVYFHADAAALARAGTGYLLGQVQAQTFRHGFCDQTVQLWTEAGELLVTSHQIVYYKE